MDLWASGRSDFRLENVEVQHRKHPDTFSIAPRRVRTTMRPYDLVKVILVLEPTPVSGLFDGLRRLTERGLSRS